MVVLELLDEFDDVCPKAKPLMANESSRIPIVFIRLSRGTDKLDAALEDRRVSGLSSPRAHKNVLYYIHAIDTARLSASPALSLSVL